MPIKTVPEFGKEVASVKVTDVVCPATKLPPLFIVVVAGLNVVPDQYPVPQPKPGTWVVLPTT